MVSMLERLTGAQNARDAARLAACFADDYLSDQPAHPDRAFSGRAQVLENWTSVFAGVPDFQAHVVASCRDGDVEWGEVDWRGHHQDGSTFAMRGVLILTIRDDLIAEGRLYVEPVEDSGDGIRAAVDELYRPPLGDS